MEDSCIACPVCTLYLRPGITLEKHLFSHPKQKVIEALCKIINFSLESNESLQRKIINADGNQPTTQTSSTNMALMPPINSAMNSNMTQINKVPINQSYIYQQFMSSSGTPPILNVNPINQINQQFVATVPSVFNPQMMCPPYIFQQQQQVQIMSAQPFISPTQQELLQRPVHFLSNPLICTSSAITEVMDPLRLTSVSESSEISQPSTSKSVSENSFPISYIPHTSSNSPKHKLPIQDPLDIIDVSESVQVSTASETLTTNVTSVATTKHETMSINDKVKNNDNLIIVASCASDIHYSEKLINVNNYDGDNSTCIPAELKEEETLRRDETLKSPVSNKSRPDIIIETNGDEVVSVTIRNVGGSVSPDLKNSLSNNNEQNHNPKIENEAYNNVCQTTTIRTIKQINENETNDINENEVIVISNQEDFEEEIQTSDISSPKNHYEHENECNGIIVASGSNLQTGDITVLDMGSVDFIIPNEFLQNGQSIISKVNEIECLNEANREDRPQVLMSIGEKTIKNANIVLEDKYIVDVHNYEDEKLDDESLSRESLNIRADERMPPRGELSEQESNGASEVGWSSRIYQEGGSGMSTSYDLIARESWEASDCSDAEIPALHSRIRPSSLDYKSDDVDDPEEIISKSPIFEFSCSTCGAKFRCPKERRVHQAQEHSTASSSSNTTMRKIVKKRQVRKTKSIQKADTLSENNLFLKAEPKYEPLDAENVTEIKIDISKLEIEERREDILCNTCGELLPTRKDWHIHNKKVHGVRYPNQNLICRTCDVSFPAHDKFREHLRIHPLECNVCGKNFFKIPNLRMHLKRHTGIRPHKCEVCGKAFFSKQKLSEHINIHTGNTPIKCTMCNHSFKRYSNLIQHRNLHHLHIKKKIKDYICHCGEIFHSKSKLLWHKETHETKPKGCKYCHEKFIHMASLTRHIRRIHNQRYVPDERRVNENVECEVCKGVYLKSSLDAHMLTHGGKKPHICQICNKEFTTKWNLKLHKWTHASPNSKPFKCDLCQAAYIRQNDYISHMNSHKSLRPYTCNYCGCKFIRKYNCIRHVREHEEGKSFTCDVCNKSFHRSYYLKEHMRIHSGVRPFTCHICGKTSTTKSNHNKHMKIHHAREPVMTEG